MWGGSGSGPDPGGTKGGDGSTGTSSQELIDLKDQFEQQQVLIAQLKEMLRKTEKTSVTQEKVEEYANTLTRMSARVKEKRKKRGDQADESTTLQDTPASEKIMLLRQQLEENKLRLAQRGKFQKGMEETVTQLKAQLDDSQQLISQTPLNLSLVETKTDYSVETCAPEELYCLLVNKDKKVAELNAKIQKLEANVLDLQENLKEKDSVIDARTKAITLMTESLSRKGKNTLDALDDTKEQMRKMQENFVSLEMEMKLEKQELLNTLEQKNTLINQLEISNSTLQANNMRLQQSLEIYQSKYGELDVDENETEPLQNPVKLLNAHIEVKNEEIARIKGEYSSLEADFLKLQSQVMSKPENVEPELEMLRNRVAELESLKREDSPRDSPQRSKKGKKGQKTKTKEVDLQKVIDNLKDECEKYKTMIMEHELTIQELNSTVVELQTASKPEADTEEFAKLKKQVDESNKNMIKIKAQHKSKIKELNKKIEELKKGKDSVDGSVEYQAEIGKLQMQIESLEKCKEELVSKLAKDATSTERVKELEAQLFEQSELLDTKNQSLDTLEAQLKSYKTELQSLSDRFNKLSHLENDQVASEMTSIHFEEQLDNLELEKKALIESNNIIMLEKESLLEKLDALMREKLEMSSKLDTYMQENMDLIDKLEKLSAEKVSSAESIEIVENLTQQEKLELEAYQQSLELVSGSINENLEPNPELNESVNQLTEETSDLLRKIELFTEERKEVMEKMEALALENSQLNLKIQEIENNRDILSETYEQLQNEKEAVEQDCNMLKLSEQELNNEINHLKKENEILKQEIKHGSENDQSILFETVMPLESEDLKNNELQKQIEEYRSLVEIQKSEIKELKVELLSYKDLPVANRELHEKITSLQEQYEIIKLENDNLSKIVKENSDIVQEKHVIETELITARKRIDEFDAKLTENIDELENYKAIIEENKEELISSANIIADLQDKVHEKQNEISHYQNEVSHLNSVIAELNSALSHLDSENQKNNDYSNTIDVMSSQLQELKILLNENISQIESYQIELKQNSDTIIKLNTQLKELNNKLLDMEHEMECKDDELKKLVKERDNKDLMIANLQSQLKDKEKHFHEVCETLNAKYTSLQAQIEQNAGSLSNIKDPLSKIEALETKNKEQFEKMKKIAANLKKKTAAFTELEAKLKELNQKLESEENKREHLTSIIEANEEKIKSQVQELQDANDKYMNLQTVLSQKSDEFYEKNHEIVNLKQIIDELQSNNQQLQTQMNELQTEKEIHNSDESNRLNAEINKKNEIIENLNHLLENTQYNAETNSNALQAKIRETEMVVENQETEITKYKDRIDKLEEFISTIEERRLSLERKAVELNAQLVEKSNSYEEISQVEGMLEQRLAALMVHDEQIEKRLNDHIVENEALIERNQQLMDENDQLRHHLSMATEKNLQSNSDTVTLLQDDVSRLEEIINRLESENKHLRDDCENLVLEKREDMEQIEVEYERQIENIKLEHRKIDEMLEQKCDELKEYSEKQAVLLEEIRELKEKLDQQQIDFDEQMNEFNKLNEENKTNLRTIDGINGDRQELQSKNEELQGLLTRSNENIETLKREVNEITNQLQHFTQANLELTEERNSVLSNTIELLDRKCEEQKLEDPEKVQPISTFKWDEVTSEDPFDFVKRNDAVEPVIEQVTEIPLQSKDKEPNEDLLLKIKSLQFMLYDTEKEKEDILSQCQKLTSEIAHLIYEKQNMESTNDGSTKLNQTILCHKCKSFCNENSDLLRDQEIAQQIVAPQDAVITRADLEELRSVEFEPTKQCVDVTDAKSREPVTEDLMQSENAYLCYPTSKPAVEEDNDQPSGAINLDVFDENDDGWGCGADEAKLEEDYHQQVGQLRFNQNLNLHIEELDEKVRALEIERDRHLEEIKQLQIKSGKLIKKLKEYKASNDKLTADLKKLDFMGLDDAIQDELKSQIIQLEKRIKETNAELQKEKTEKTNLLQKMNTLKASHERLTETQEKQNIDFMVLQRQHHELTVKLEQLEWESGDFDSPVHVKRESHPQESNLPIGSLEKKIAELNETVKELTLDNEELQTMLEEQRTLRISAEKSKSMEPVAENLKTETEYLEIVSERNALNDQLLLSVEDKKRTQEELNSLIKIKAQLEINFDRLKEEKTNLEAQLSQVSLTLENALRESQEHQLTCNTELEEWKQKAMELNNQVTAFQNYKEENQFKNLRLQEVEGDLNVITAERNELLKELEDKNTQLSNLSISMTENEQRKSELESILQQLQALADENKALKEQIHLHEISLQEKSKQLEEMDNERSAYNTTLQQLADEWSQRVDQRGSDVAESWKLHLEAQETEFAQTQLRLQKEMNDLEEKCNALVNENNELRKNVDAEIKNEVDKISALQQQINSRQHYINELTHSVQEYQTKLNAQELQLTEYQNFSSKVDNEIKEKDDNITALSELVNNLKTNIDEKVETIRELDERLKSFEGLQAELDQQVQLRINLENELKTKQSINEYNEKLVLEIQTKNSDLLEVNVKLSESIEEKRLQSDQISLLENQLGDLQVQFDEKLVTIEFLNNQINTHNLHTEEKEKKITDLTNELLRLSAIIEENRGQIVNQAEKYKETDEEIYKKDAQISELTLELNNIKILLNEKEKEYHQQLELITQNSLQKESEFKVYYDKLLRGKDAELEGVNTQLLDQTHTNEALTNMLNEQDSIVKQIKAELIAAHQECDILKHKLLEEETLHSDENKQLSELSQIIEDQVLKIEELKHELFEKSKDYDSLIAELDLRKPASNLHQQELSDQVPDKIFSNDENNELNVVSRAELDLALYMLHQRDVRCEELTVELMQLLEERDTLQLKLSNEIREKEGLRRKLTPELLAESASDGLYSTSTLSPNTILINETTLNEDTETGVGTDPLANKLSELKSVGYRKDKTLLDEQEKRRLLQLSLMQQHRDVAAMLPPEAAARLVQEASYTLSRDVQSPSKVLLNWLWGKSTPKVNDV